MKGKALQPRKTPPLGRNQASNNFDEGGRRGLNGLGSLTALGALGEFSTPSAPRRGLAEVLEGDEGRREGVEDVFSESGKGEMEEGGGVREGREEALGERVRRGVGSPHFVAGDGEGRWEGSAGEDGGY